MTYFLDTNIFLRVIAQEDKTSFEECKKLLEMIKNNQIRAVTSSLVLAEINWVLSSHYKWPKERVVRSLKAILNLTGLKLVDDGAMKRGVELYEEKNVKYVDAMVASTVEKKGKNWTVVSYDTDFKKLPVKWMKPGVVLGLI